MEIKKITQITAGALFFVASIGSANAFNLFGWFGSDKKEEPKVQYVQVHTCPDQSQITQTSRYTFVKDSIPTNHIDLLQQNVSITFGDNITTIGQALNQLLLNSGFRLQPADKQDKYERIMLANSLPATLRTIKNATLLQSIVALTGENFTVTQDPITRTIYLKVQSTKLATHLNDKDIDNAK